MKRFYKQVSVTPAGGILLDARPVKTPAKALLLLPNSALAESVADEWRAQETEINPHNMPITGLANAAIDRMSPEFTAGLAAYGETELLCYRAVDPPELVKREAAVWNPILDWAQSRYDVGFTKVTGIMHQSQPAETLKRLAAALSAYGPFHIAALSPIVTISGSLAIALAVAEGHLKPDAAFDAAHLDELWQAEQWGEDYFATETRNAHRTDFLAACRFLSLLDI